MITLLWMVWVCGMYMVFIQRSTDLIWTGEWRAVLFMHGVTEQMGGLEMDAMRKAVIACFASSTTAMLGGTCIVAAH